MCVCEEGDWGRYQAFQASVDNRCHFLTDNPGFHRPHQDIMPLQAQEQAEGKKGEIPNVVAM